MTPKSRWPALLLGLGVLLWPARARADGDPAADAHQLVQLHAQMQVRTDALQKAIEGLTAATPPADPAAVKKQREDLTQLLAVLPEEVERYRALQTRLHIGETDPQLAVQLQALIKRAAELQQAYALAAGQQAPGAPAATAPSPVELTAQLRSVKDKLGLLMGRSVERYPNLTASANQVRAQGGGGGQSSTIQTGRNYGTVSRTLGCAGVFDGGGCGSSTSVGPGNGPLSSNGLVGGRGNQQSGAGTAVNGGVTGRNATVVANGTNGVGGTARSGVLTSNTNGSMSGGNPNLDGHGVPGVGGGTPGLTTIAGTAQALKPPPAPKTLACQTAVNGPDAAHPEHESLAGHCENWPTMVPIAAGLLDSLKEQFGTVEGVVMNVIFFILGLIMSVLTGAVGLILKLIALIGMSYAIFQMLRGLYNAISALVNSKEDSVEHAKAIRDIAKIGGGIIIMVMMVLVGMKAGKSGAMKAMESGTAGIMEKLGITGGVEALNAKIPPQVTSMLERFLGPATKPGQHGGQGGTPGENNPGASNTGTTVADRGAGNPGTGAPGVTAGTEPGVGPGGQPKTVSRSASTLSGGAGEPHPQGQAMSELTSLTEPKPGAVGEPVATNKGNAPHGSGETPVVQTVKPESIEIPDNAAMKANRGKMEQLVEGYAEERLRTGGNEKTINADRLVSGLDHGVELPPLDPKNPGLVAQRNNQVAQFAKKYLGLEGEVTVKGPDTPPLSGAEIFLVKNAQGEVVAVYKVFPKSGEVVRELGGVAHVNGMGDNPGMGLTESRGAAKPYGAWKLPEGKVGYMMEGAPGQDVYGIIKGLKNAPDRVAGLQAVEGSMDKVAGSMAELHGKGQGVEIPMARKQEIVAGAAKNLDELRSPNPGGKVARTWTIPDNVYEKLSAKLKAQGQRFEATRLPGTITHGDAHPGNFFVSKTGKVTMIDIETIMESMEPGGAGINPAAMDVARFAESIELNNGAKGLGLGAGEVEQVVKSFSESYFKKSGLKPAARADFEAAVEFYRTKMQVTALKYAENKEHFDAFCRMILGR